MDKNTRTPTITIWKVDMEDLTNLGGPMGTEYTTPLGSKVFKTDKEVIEFIKKKTKGETVLTKVKPGFHDCRWIGFKIERVKI